ncbi:MAG: DUF2569 domain-containing protein [Acidobacteriia bacterium]|nr:DUF2569 domain-containing protein [Terriglobia bacterium]
MEFLNGRQRKTELQGVGGWLLLFCVLVTIIGPAVAVFSYSAEFARILESWDGFGTVATFHLVVDVAGLGLTAFAVYAGMALWTIRPNAVRTAKSFLIVGFAFRAITELACLSLGTSDLFWVPAPTVESTVGDEVRNAISFVIWFTYFKESKRVKATYGSPDAGAAR